MYINFCNNRFEKSAFYFDKFLKETGFSRCSIHYCMG